MPEELPCDVYGSLGRADITSLCDKCNKGTHTECLDPPLSEVSQGGWLCPDLEGPKYTSLKTPAKREFVDLTDTRVDIM